MTRRQAYVAGGNISAGKADSHADGIVTAAPRRLNDSLQATPR